MSLQIWLPLTGHTKNKGLWASTTEFSVTNTSCITVNNSGKIGKCYNFNSTVTNSGIFHADGNYMSEHINNHSFSICAWIQTTSTDTCVISLSYGLRLFAGDSSHTYITLYNSSRTVGCAASMAVNDGKWHHLCSVYDVITNKIQIYVDGIKKNEVSYTSGYTYASSWNNGLFIGRDPNNSTVNDHYLYKGNINDVRIYDHALSVAEIKDISKGLCLHYKLDDFYGADNLIVNGYGELGTENWNGASTSYISTTEIPSDHPEIKASFYNGNSTKEYIPITTSHSYTVSGYIKAMSGRTGSTYPSIFPYDIDKKFIDYYKTKDGFNNNAYMTTLSQPLHKGDTVIHATDLSAWTTGENYYFHVAIFGYKDSLGQLYPDMTYTQDAPSFGTRTDKSNIDKTNNTITLKAAFTGEDRPAGTVICQSTEGSTYYYPWGGINLTTITDWTFKTATFKPMNANRLKYAAYIRWSTYGSSYIAGNRIVDNMLTTTEVVDSSGYGNHGTKSGNISVSYNSPRYDVDTVFDSGSHIYTPALSTAGIANSYTFSWWGKFTKHTSHMMWGFSDGNRLNLYMASKFYWNTGDGTSNSFNISTSTYADNNWHHFVVTGDGTVTKLYIDGLFKANASVYKGVTGTTIYLNGWDSGTNYNFNGQLSDFRIYATALSAEDVLALYNVGARVFKNGMMAGYELKEGNW